MTAWYFRYELKFTSPEVDLLWSKLPVEKDGLVSFAHLVEFSFLNFNVTTAGEESGQAASGECIFSIKGNFYFKPPFVWLSLSLYAPAVNINVPLMTSLRIVTISH